jgi:hypothetical protein
MESNTMLTNKTYYYKKKWWQRLKLVMIKKVVNRQNLLEIFLQQKLIAI